MFTPILLFILCHCIRTVSKHPIYLYEFVYVVSEGLLKEDMLMLSFYPDLKEVSITSGGEYIFVIDRSGRYTALTVCFTRGGILVLYNCDVSFAIYLHFLWYGMHLDILMICIIL